MFARGLLLSLLVLWLAGCGESPETPDARIRALIDEAVTGAETGDIDPFKAAMSGQFRSADGHDRDDMLNRLRLYMLGEQSLHLLVRVEEIEVLADDLATARVLVGAARRPIESPDVLSGYRASVHRVDLSLALSDGDWRVHRAEWERVSPGQLIRLW
jgi:hypothetical protein